MKKNIKQKKKTKNNKRISNFKIFNNKKNSLFLIIILTVLMLSIILLFFLNFNKKITCIKTTGDKNVLVQNKNVTISFKGKKIQEVGFTKVLTFDEEYITYIDIVKEALEKEYKLLNLDNSVVKEDNNLIVNIKYTENKKYILDNIDVSLDEGSVNISIISDIYNNSEYESIDLSKEGNSNDIMSYFKKSGYECK